MLLTSFYSHWKQQKTRFFDVIKVYRKRAVAWNVLRKKRSNPGKCGPEQLRIRTLFTRWWVVNQRWIILVGISNVSKVIRKCFESFLPKFDCFPLLGDQSACGNSTDIFRNNVKGKSKTMYTLYIKGRKYLNQRTDYIQLFYQVQVSL